MRIRKRYTVEHLVCGHWTYYFGSDSRPMAESIGLHLQKSENDYRILDGKQMVTEYRHPKNVGAHAHS